MGVCVQQLGSGHGSQGPLCLWCGSRSKWEHVLVCSLPAAFQALHSSTLNSTCFQKVKMGGGTSNPKFSSLSLPPSCYVPNSLWPSDYEAFWADKKLQSWILHLQKEWAWVLNYEGNFLLIVDRVLFSGFFLEWTLCFWKEVFRNFFDRESSLRILHRWRSPLEASTESLNHRITER